MSSELYLSIDEIKQKCIKKCNEIGDHNRAAYIAGYMDALLENNDIKLSENEDQKLFGTIIGEAAILRRLS